MVLADLGAEVMTMHGQRLGVRLSPPRLGEHSREVLVALGYDKTRIAEMRRTGAVVIG